jgi:hypothetical protein
VTQLEALKSWHGVQQRLLAIQQALDIAELKEPNMAVDAQTAALIAKFDAATTAIANRIAALVAGANPGLSADDTAAFQAEIDKLTALGANPANPVPPPAA